MGCTTSTAAVVPASTSPHRRHRGTPRPGSKEGMRVTLELCFIDQMFYFIQKIIQLIHNGFLELLVLLLYTLRECFQST